MRANISLYTLCIILVILGLSYTWGVYSWTMNGIYSSLLGIFTIFSLFICYGSRLYKISKDGIILLLLLVVGAVLAYRHRPNAIFVELFSFLPLISLFKLNSIDLRVLIKGIAQILSVLIAVSLLLYFLRLFGFSLPFGNRVYFNQYEFQNYYYLFLYGFRYDNKFCGFSLEPGYFSLLCICVLSVYEFDLKNKYSWPVVTALFLTLSLGGYILVIVGYTITKSISKNKISKYIGVLIAITIGLIMLFYFFLSYNGGDNVIAHEILSRLIIDDELGIVGNNRENYLAKDVIDSFFYSSDVWKGIGNDAFVYATKIEGYDACSWRQFIVVRGAIFTAIFFVYTLHLLRQSEWKKVLPFYIIYWLDFMQHGTLYSESLYFLIIMFLIHPKNEYVETRIS